MTQATDTTQVSSPPRAVPPAGSQANASGVAPGPGVSVSVPGFNPNAPPAGEVEAAYFHSAEDARAAADAVRASGIPTDSVFLLLDAAERRTFLKPYIRRDSDRHSHSGTAPVYAGLIGALACGLIGVATAGQFAAGQWGPVAGGLIGGLIGAILGGVTGGFALRQADDRSMEIVDNLSASGPMVVVRCPDTSPTPCLEDVGKIPHVTTGRRCG
jgi:hypothetical protein